MTPDKVASQSQPVKTAPARGKPVSAEGGKQAAGTHATGGGHRDRLATSRRVKGSARARRCIHGRRDEGAQWEENKPCRLFRHGEGGPSERGRRRTKERHLPADSLPATRSPVGGHKAVLTCRSADEGRTATTRSAARFKQGRQTFPRRSPTRFDVPTDCFCFPSTAIQMLISHKQ